MSAAPPLPATESGAPPKPAAGRADGTQKGVSPRATALIVASALFMEQLDGTVLATALPTMARSFDVDALHMNVALTAYLLSLAVFIPASGKMADRFGSRTVFRAAIGLFTLGSILCAQAPTLLFLVAARILQGIGGAMMVPVGRLVLLRSVSKAELVQAMAETSSAFEAVRSSTSRPTGTIIAPPTPCRMREPTRKIRLGACAHRIEPMVNSAIAPRNTVRDPKRSAALPLAGMNTARLSR